MMPVAPPFGDLPALARQFEAIAADIRVIHAHGQPHDRDLRDAPLLEAWTFALVSAPCLVGRVSKHPLLGDRHRIHTSQLVALDADQGWVRTWSRFYRLGSSRDVPLHS